MLNLKNTTIIPLSGYLLDGSFNFLIDLKNAERNYFLDLQPCAKKIAAKEHNPHPRTQLQISLNATKYAFIIKVMIQ